MALKNYCQSCGASIAEPEAQRGVEKDGSVSEEYCAHCYQNGEFCVESYEETLERSSQNFHPALKKLEDPMEFYGKFLPTLGRWRGEKIVASSRSGEKTSAADVEAKANAILAKCPVVTLASLEDDGMPRPYPMVKNSKSCFRKMYFVSTKSAAKVSSFLNRRAAGVSYYSGEDSVSATGFVRILGESEKGAYWEDGYARYFPNGPEDPEFTILELVLFRVVVLAGGQKYMLTYLT